MDDVIVLGDFLGYVHWLDKASGAIAARVHAGKARISTPPVVVGNLVVVVTDRGQINTYRVSPLAAPARGKKTVPETPAPPPAESK